MEGLAVPFTAVANGLKSILDFIKNPLNNIVTGIQTLLSYLNPFSENFFLKVALIPDEDFFTNKVNAISELINTKIPIIGDIQLITSSIVDSFQNGMNGDVPQFRINLPSKYGGSSVSVIDFSFYSEYRFLINSFIIMTSYFFFIKRMIKRIPQIIYI